MRRLARVCLASVRLCASVSRVLCVSRLCPSRVGRLVWRLSRVCVRLASVVLSRVCLASCASRVCLASVSVSRRSSCLASVSRLCPSRVGRLVSRLSRVCVRLASVVLSRVCLASCASRVCVRLASVVLSRVCLASVSVSRRSSCLASVSRLCPSRVGRLVSRLSRVCVRLASVVLSRVCLASVVLSRVWLASVSRLCVCVRLCLASCASRVCLSRVCVSRLSVSRLRLAHFMRRSSFKRVFAIVILSYNVPMPKYPSHHLIYVFYHPMPIMPLY